MEPRHCLPTTQTTFIKGSSECDIDFFAPGPSLLTVRQVVYYTAGPLVASYITYTRYVLNRYLGTYPSLSADVALGSGECQDSVTHQNKEVVCYVADSLVVRWLTYNNISWYLINLQLCLQRSQLRLPLQSLPVPAAASIGSVHRVLIDRYSNGSWPADYRTLSVLCPSAGCV